MKTVETSTVTAYANEKSWKRKYHFSIFVTVPIGEGDYGTDSKCVFDGLATHIEADQQAHSTANLLRTKVQLTRGKEIGRLVATYGE